MNLGLKIQKTNVEIRISILEIPCVPIFRQIDNFDFFGPKLPKNGFKMQKTNVGIIISIVEIPYVPIFKQNDQL